MNLLCGSQNNQNSQKQKKVVFKVKKKQQPTGGLNDEEEVGPIEEDINLSAPQHSQDSQSNTCVFMHTPGLQNSRGSFPDFENPCSEHEHEADPDLRPMVISEILTRLQRGSKNLYQLGPGKLASEVTIQELVFQQIFHIHQTT